MLDADAVNRAKRVRGLGCTYRTSTVSGAVHASAIILISSPQGRPRLKRSFGSGLPKQRRQINAAMQKLYENVIAIIVSETIALKPTTGPKLIRARMQVNIIDTQTARRGTS